MLATPVTLVSSKAAGVSFELKPMPEKSIASLNGA
jgi:hypothetical protein